MTCRARVLYENHRNDVLQFGFHALICALVDDRLGTSWFARHHIHGMPRNGRDRLLSDCGERAGDVFADLAHQARFAIVDGDKLTAALRLRPDSPLEQIRASLRSQYPAVQIFVPDAATPKQSNTEGVLRALASCLGLPENDPDLRAALQKSRNALTARDRIFLRALDEDQRAARKRFLEQQPSLAELVHQLAELVRPALRGE